MSVRGAVWIAVVLSAGHAAWADEANKPAPAAFRRVAIPADEMVQRVRDSGVEHRRVPPEKFNRLTDILRDHAADPDATARTHVAAAEFDARLVNDTLVGDARLSIKHPLDAPSLMPLSPCGLAIGEREAPARWRYFARWLDNPPRRATLGVASDGQTCVLVEDSGELEFGWSLRGRRGERGMLEFPLALPSSPMRTLHLDSLPANLEPVVSHGTVERLKKAEQERHSWQVRLGGGSAATLTLVDTSVPAPAPDVRVRQSLAYEIWPHGTNLTVELTLDVRGAPLRQLELALDPGLELLKAEYRERPVHWTPPQDNQDPKNKKGKKANRGSSIVLHFPSPLLGRGHVVMLNAAAKPEFDRRITLPRLRPSGVPWRDQTAEVFWQDGTARVWVAQSLSLEYLSTRDARQSSRFTRQPLPTRQQVSGEQFAVQLFAPEAAVDVQLAHAKPRLEVSTATSLTLGQSETRGRLVADLLGTQGDVFTLRAEVGPRWTIDRITPEDAVEDWNLLAGSSAGRVLEIHLAQPLKPAGALRLTITGRRLGPALATAADAPPLRLADLQMLRFDEARVRRRLLGIAAGSLGQPRLRRAHDVRRLDPAKLSPTDQRLLPRPAPEMILELDGHAPQCELTVERETRRLGRIKISVEALVTADALQESYVIDCSPNTAVGEIEVRFSHARQQPLRWTLASEDDLPITATSRESSGEELWSVRLPRPRSAPFKLRATRSTPLPTRLAISLPRLPDAQRQDGQLLVRGSSRMAFDIENHRLTAVPAPPAAAKAPPLRAAFRFDPTRDAASAVGGDAVTIVRGPTTANAVTGGALVWDARFDSFYEPSGRARHVATFDLENTESRQFLPLRLPQGAGQVEIHVNKTAIEATPTASGEWDVPLAGTPRRVTLRVQYVTDGLALGFTTDVAAPLPQLDVPVVAEQWTIWLPASHEAVALSSAWQLERRPRTVWLDRLFGPLASRLTFASSEMARTQARVASLSLMPLVARGDEAAGWQAYVFRGRPGTAPQARVVHTAALQTAGWALLPLVAIGVWCVGPRPWKWLLGLTVALAAVALFVPPVYIPVTSLAMVGTLAGWLAIFISSLRRKADTAPARTAKGSSIVRTGIAVLAATASWGVAAAWGQEPRDLPAVLIPADAQGDTSGAKEFLVPAPLWDKLQRQVAEIQRQPRGWLIERADYTVKLLAPAAAEERFRADLLASFNLQTFDAAAQVRIDFGAPVAATADDDVAPILDGQEAKQLTWDETGRVCTFVVAEPGSHSLTMPFRARIVRDGNAWRFDQPVPVVANAQLSVALPARGDVAAELVSAVGKTETSDNGRVLRAQLGPAPRITLRWKDASQPTESPAVEVDELLWLNVKPGSVSLKVKVLFHVPRGNLRRVRLAADRALQLRGDFQLDDGTELRPELNRPAVEDRGTADPRVFTLALERPRSGRFAVEAEFLLDETPGIGVLRLPRLDVLDVPRVRRSLAVSLDPELQHQEPQSDDAPRTALSNFLQRWGEGEPNPSFVRDLSDDPWKWSLKTRFRPTEKSVRQSLAIRLSSGRADLRYEADVSITRGSGFQHRLLVPPELVIDDVTLARNGKPLAVRWSSTSGMVTLFLPEGAGATQRLILRGHLETPASGTWRPPNIEFQETEIQEVQTTAAVTRIFRQQDVRVIFPARTAKIVNTPNDEIEPWTPGQGRFVAEFSPPTAASKVALRLQPDRPTVLAPLALTVLRQDEDRWLADVFLDFEVGRGTLDWLAFDLPAEITGLVEADPPGRLELQTALGGERNQWRYLPDEPLSEEQRIRLTFAVPQGPGRPLAAPDIRPVLSSPVPRFLALPAEGEARAANWQVQQLTRLARRKIGPETRRRARLSEIVATIPRPLVLFRAAADERFTARLRPTQRVRGKPRVPLADVVLHCLADGSCHGVVRFELVPNGSDSCQLQMPSGLSLLRATVAGMSAVTSAAVSGRQRLRLASARLPQQIEVVFAGSLDVTLADQCPLAVPTIADVPAERTLWSIHVPPGYAAEAPSEGNTLDDVSGRLLRLRTASESIRTAADHLSPETTASWYQPRLAKLMQDIAQLRQQASTASDELNEKLKAVEDQQAETARQLGTEDFYQRQAKKKQTKEKSTTPSLATARDNRLLIAGPAGSLALTLHPPGQESVFWRVLLLAILVVAAAFAMRVPREGPRGDEEHG